MVKRWGVEKIAKSVRKKLLWETTTFQQGEERRLGRTLLRRGRGGKLTGFGSPETRTSKILPQS